MIDNYSDNFKNVKNVKNVKGALGLNSSGFKSVSVALNLLGPSLKIIQHRLYGENTTQLPKRSIEENEETSSKGSCGDHHGQQAVKRLKMIRSSEILANAPGTGLWARTISAQAEQAKKSVLIKLDIAE